MKQYHKFYDALGRVHYYYGTDDEAGTAGDGFSIIIVGGTPHAEIVDALNDSGNPGLSELATAINNPHQSGFLQGDALIAFAAQSQALWYGYWRKANSEASERTFNEWVASNVGNPVPTSMGDAQRFYAICAAVLRHNSIVSHAA